MLTLQEYSDKIEVLTSESKGMVDVLNAKASESTTLQSELKSIANEVDHTIANEVRVLTEERLNALIGKNTDG